MGCLPVVTMVTSLIVLLSGSGDASKILLLPLTAGSHLMNFEQIAKALMVRGHELHTYLNIDCKGTNKMRDIGVKVHTYINERDGCHNDNATAMGELLKSAFSDKNFIIKLNDQKEYSDKMYHEVLCYLGNESAMEELKSVGFDLCILDGLYQTPFLHIIPYRLNLPVVSFMATFNPLLAGAPALPSFTPYINMGEFTNEMTFTERVINSLMVTAFDSFVKFMNPMASNKLVSKFAPEKPFMTLDNLQSRTKLWLVMSDIAIDYPQVRMPHIVNIGGSNTRPPNKLPKYFQDLADQSEHGVILVSFGSYVTSFPDHIKETLMDAFRRLDQTVIWRVKVSDKDNVPANLHPADWMPQNDLLAHPNTKLFITHCGANSQFEALYNGVPMLGLPVFGDQVYNARRMQLKGLGIQMDLMKVTADELVVSINEILNNGSYKEAMTLHSGIFKDRPMTPMETLVYWLEHILKYGSEHMVSPAVEFPWYKYWCVDVALFLVFVISLLVLCTYASIRCTYKCLCRLRKQKVKEQ